ncbi:MAG: hypothetical protein QW587_10010 [Candidatus Bathyarchaeia archaeon]
MQNDIERRKQTISKIRSCNECGECEKRCRYSLPIVRMLRDMVEPMEDILRI